MKRDVRTHARTDGRRTDFGTKLIYPFSKEKVGIITKQMVYLLLNISFKHQI